MMRSRFLSGSCANSKLKGAIGRLTRLAKIVASTQEMAVSKYKYVKDFEQPDQLLPHTFIVLRVDGRGFHKFTTAHHFRKPNDLRALNLMDRAAQVVMASYPDVLLAFGQSDEYSFLFRKNTLLYGRRSSKILSTVVSLFTSAYVMHWHHFFDTPLPQEHIPPSFDGRIVLYPTEKEVRDYFAWRQVDTHINNLYNTTFWALVQEDGLSTEQAHSTLKVVPVPSPRKMRFDQGVKQGTSSSQKQEMLFSKFKVNYNNLEAQFRKGTTICRRQSNPSGIEMESADASQAQLLILHCDIISESFWSKDFDFP